VDGGVASGSGFGGRLEPVEDHAQDQQVGGLETGLRNVGHLFVRFEDVTPDDGAQGVN